MTMTTTIVEAPCNKVLRRYAITPGTIQGRKLAEDCEVVLRYSELDAINLHRDATEAAAEALRFAAKKGMVPKGIDADVVCVRETLRRA